MLRIDQVISSKIHNHDRNHSRITSNPTTMDNPRAILSVWNKESIVPFAKSLIEMGWTIISTGGTSNKLRDSGNGNN